MKINASIIGATGYTGLELVRLLHLHPNVEISSIVSRSNDNVSIQSLYPSLNAIPPISFEQLDIEKIAAKSDVVFSALPHKASMEIISQLNNFSVKIIDLSADFRFSNIETYEKFYCEHICKDISANAVYGLPEVFRDKIKDAKVIANPGCYPTSAILALYPILKEKIKISPNIIVDSKSGVTGAGRNPSLKTLFTEVYDNFSAYSVGKHRHQPEIEEKLTEIYNSPLKVTFTPHLLPINRGILSTLYIDTLDDSLSSDKLSQLYIDTYKNDYFVKIMPKGETPSTAYVKASNFCFIGFLYIPESKKLIVVSVIDNIVKGASGQAIQNMNILFGLPEHTGLTAIPTFL